MQQKQQRKIYALSEEEICKISAGEVVESPKNALKELIENSMDAGAKNISVYIEEGGFKKMVVIDDGEGMNEEDLIFSVERHTTSKIRRHNDLESLVTYGFRGEALSSIAAISEVVIHTAEKEPLGKKLSVFYGKKQEVEDQPRQKGTTVSVHHVFSNVPARKAFQKSPATSTREIKALLRSLFISRSDISMTLFVDHVQVVFASENDMQKRVQQVFGFPWTDQAKVLSWEKEGLRFFGLFAPAEMTHLSRNRQWLFVNGRYVFSHAISHAVREGYATMIGERTFPMFFLWIDLPPHEVNVNIHPQKREIAWNQDIDISKMIADHVRNLFFRKTVFVQKTSFPTKSLSDFSFKEEEIFFPQNVPQQTQLAIPFEVVTCFGQIALVYYEGKNIFIHLAWAEETLYLEEIYHATQKKEKLPMQALLFPIDVVCSKNDIDWIEEHEDVLLFWGFEGNIFGERTFSITAMSHFYSEENAQNLVHAIIEDRISSAFLVKNLRIPSTYTLSHARKIVARVLEKRFFEAWNGKKFFQELDQQKIVGRIFDG